MNAKERYERIIAEIEIGAADPYTSTDELEDQVIQKLLMDRREVSAVFKFLTDSTMRSYIIERKMMASYRLILSQHRRNIEAAAELAGYDLQTYSKKFSKMFGLPPKNAFTNKDESLVRPPLTWDIIAGDAEFVTAGREEATMPTSLVFGVTQEQYDAIVQVQNLCADYEFSMEIGQIAYEMSKEIERSIGQVFSYFESIRDYVEQYGEDLDAIEDEIREFAGVDFYKSMFFDRGLSYALARYLEEVQHVPRDEIETLDPRMLSSFADTYDMSFEYYKRAWKYYNEHATNAYTQENFEEFVESLDKNVPIELAFEAVIPGDFSEDIESYMCAPDSGIDEDEVVSFEQWATEQTNWQHNRFDTEPDVENLAYDDDDPPLFDF